MKKESFVDNNTPGKDYVLAIDNGTQSVRALLFDLQGNLLGKGKVELQAYYSSQPGWAEQDPDYYWRKLGEACQQLWAQTGIDRSLIRGVSLTTQRGTLINVDAQGQALRPAILWLDQRQCEPKGGIKGPWGWLFKLIGAQATVDYFRAQAEANWIAQHQPDIWAATDKFLLLSGFLSHRLTGRFVDSVGCCVGYLPFDFKHLRWAAPRDWKWQALAVRAEQLPSLYKPGEELGRITAEASRHTGIPEGLPLIAAGSDKACEVLGSGVVEATTACLSYGTTATITTTRSRYLEIVPLIPPYPAAIPDHYNCEVMIYRGYWMVSWFKNEFGLREMQQAREQGLEPEQLFDALVNAVPPGSMGLTLQPYWSPGIREPGVEAKGAMIGFGDVHTRAHIYRAILEGLAYALRQGKERIERRSKTPIKRLRVAGGGSQSDAAMQLTADIFGLPAERPHVFEASGLGAAIACAVGLGLYPDFDTAIAAMTRTAEVFMPQPEAQQMYDRLYREVYLHMYRQLKPLYQSIREITGYPA
ncbi:FGGY family of carbohydrate kinase [Pseudomonas sp. FH4]|jgi:sugar (pentulose or hexulose) kinase|uniref:Carbohydrate kinase n=1 Tax=Pseudomonas brenneri TaxID=129817 RepID=A0A5B2UL40_9PSED|nr:MULTISPECIES: FGGY-family carbohydrate kinase [Pseudomonas]ETK16625.1 FGGY family of carbohydrate kinase [Pseudomonas sp. FH4]KAA2226585.1 carbohydrate kinase [Pseudomonas brenneri]MBF8007817.1 FGGY-family carbohydrate kinase [Pseudomonas brenneri]TWR74728.1 carbohydrate kinase [Pseudomonas brenneri]WJM90789.1 FGGY-family carbohydrate kinase [Pseudomonas brenneri]